MKTHTCNGLIIYKDKTLSTEDIFTNFKEETLFTIDNGTHILDILEFTLPFIVTICVMYITYQQWLINKRDEFFSTNKNIKEEWYTPLKELMQEITNISDKTNISIDKKNEIIKRIKDIKKLHNNIRIIFLRSEYEILMETFDKLIALTENFEKNTKGKGYIALLKNSFKYAHYLLLIRHMLLRTDQPFYKPTITIYTIAVNLLFSSILFFVPYFIEKKLRKTYYSFLVWIKIILPALKYIKSLFKNKKTDTKKDKPVVESIVS